MSYASDDPATRLAAVREAIQRVLNGQEYEIQDRRLRRASLKELHALETSLASQVNVAAASGGGGFTLAQIDPPI